MDRNTHGERFAVGVERIWLIVRSFERQYCRDRARWLLEDERLKKEIPRRVHRALFLFKYLTDLPIYFTANFDRVTMSFSFQSEPFRDFSYRTAIVGGLTDGFELELIGYIASRPQTPPSLP